jgi:uncharacterized RDD family membrane protein YckC
LSTLVSQPALEPSWKQEVNRRLAAHKSRKGLAVVAENASAETQSTASSRAAQAAARVAARYAKAPSFSEMQAAEARAALRAAETATRAALEAQAAAQVALANLQSDPSELPFIEEEEVAPAATTRSAAPVAEPVWESQPPMPPVATVSHAGAEALEIRWDPELPVRSVEIPPAPAAGEREEFESAEDGWWGSATLADASASHEVVEPAQPIHANLIEFPRELVATRRMRPRLTGAQLGQNSEPNGQLSIFEVDPSSISIEPEGTAAAVEEPAPVWKDPEWSAIELDEQPEEELAADPAAGVSVPELQLASFGRRLLGTVVDSALILGASCGAAFAIASHMHQLPAVKTMELAAAAIVIAFGALYQVFFLTLCKATPGMKYAGLTLCTFDDEAPSRAQRCGRLGAMALSLAPVGVGAMWSIFDDDHLSWHDRLSRTYLRKY